MTTTLTLDRVINYDYDNLYRLTEASYSTGEQYEYGYDPVGNRLQQVIEGDTTDYLYDAANRLEQVAVSGQPVVNYSFDDNGNLLATEVMTNTWDAANRLTQTQRDGMTIEPIYNGVGDRVGQTVGVSTTNYALDVIGLPEVIYTSEGNVYLHLPGVIVAENSEGETRYLLSDGLGSIRQATGENGEVVAYNEFDPYGNPVENDGGEPYGYAGEWYDSQIDLLHLRARWYAPETGTFLSIDPVEDEPPYQYVRGNPVNRVDPSGYVYVTFDDGPVDNDARILDILQSHNAKATFFYHGNQIDLLNPLDVEVIWRVAAEGHRLANHSFRHTDLREECIEDVAASLISTEGAIRIALLQVKRTQPMRYQSLPVIRRDYIDNVIKQGTGIFRPPGGDLTFGQQFQLECNEVVYGPGGSYPIRGRCREGIPGPYNVLRWTVDPQDWKLTDSEEVFDRIVNGWYETQTVRGVDIPIGQITRELLGPSSFGSYGVRSNSDNILLHSTANPTVEALDRVIRWLRNQGYTFDLLEPAWSTRD